MNEDQYKDIQIYMWPRICEGSKSTNQIPAPYVILYMIIDDDRYRKYVDLCVDLS